jgi:hypothetical protein
VAPASIWCSLAVRRQRRGLSRGPGAAAQQRSGGQRPADTQQQPVPGPSDHKACQCRAPNTPKKCAAHDCRFISHCSRGNITRALSQETTLVERRVGRWFVGERRSVALCPKRARARAPDVGVRAAVAAGSRCGHRGRAHHDWELRGACVWGSARVQARPHTSRPVHSGQRAVCGVGGVGRRERAVRGQGRDHAVKGNTPPLLTPRAAWAACSPALARSSVQLPRSWRVPAH